LWAVSRLKQEYNNMSLRDDIKGELAAAYALGIAEGERRALNRLLPENISQNLTAPEQFFPQVQGEQYSNCNKGKAVAVGGGCPPVSPTISLDKRANVYGPLDWD
jgi:hypothetical protein